MATLDIGMMQNKSDEELIPPAWTVWSKRASESDKVEWFKKALRIQEQRSEERVSTAINNMLWYTGEYEKTAEYRIVVPGQGEQVVPRKLIPRIFNQIYELTEQRVSRVCRYRADFEVVPTNLEESDRIRARLLDTALLAFARREHIDSRMAEIERWNAVFGEVLILTEWNPESGDKKGYRSLERIGDVKLDILEPWRFFPEPKYHREDVSWMILIRDVIHIEEARKRYKMPSLEPDNRTNVYEFNEWEFNKRVDEVVVYQLIQRPTVFLPEGAITTFCADRVVDESKNYPYSHLEFPFEWYTDIDVPGRLFPMSFYQHLKPIQHCYNKLTSLMVRNTLLTQHPHVLLPEGSAKIEAFANQPSVIRYNPIGGAKPEIVTFRGLNQETIQLWNAFKGELETISGVSGVSRGAPPPGTRSNSMLKFYEEQEEQRATTTISKHNELIRQIYRKAASVMCDYYPNNKDRLIRVLGAENEYLIDKFLDSKPSSEYDVVILNSTGFSRSMAGRLEEVEKLQQVAPGLLQPDQIADVLELKSPQRAYDIATNSMRFARLNCELLMNGKEPPMPERFWDLLIHWRETMIMMNSTQWSRVTPEIKETAAQHMLAIEMLMADKAAENAAFAQKLAMLDLFPVFYTIEPAPPESQQPQAQSPQAAPPADPAMMGAPMPPDAGMPMATDAGQPLPMQAFPPEAIGAPAPENPVNPLLGMV